MLFCITTHLALHAQEDISPREATIAAEKVINSIRSNKYTTLAELLVLRIQYLDLVGKSDLKPDEKIKIFNTLGFSFHAEGIPSESIRCYKMLLAEYQAWKSEHPSADSNEFLPDRTFAYAIISRSFAKFNQLDSANIYLQKAISISEASETIYYPSALNNYGLLLSSYEEEMDSALYYFRKAFEITQNNFPDHSLLGSIRDNLADNYLEKGDLNQARALYLENFDYFRSQRSDSGEIEDLTRMVSAGIQLINTDLSLNAPARARNNLEILEASIVNQKLSAESEIDFFNLKHRMFELDKQLDSAYIFAQKVLFLKDSVNRVNTEKTKANSFALNDIVMERVNLSHQMEQNQKANQLKTQRFITGIVILSAIVIITLIYFLYQRRNQHLKNLENERLITDQAWHLEKLKSAQLKSEIDSKQRDLSDFAINLSHNYQWARELYEKFQKINLTKGRGRAKLLLELEEDIRKKIDFNSDTEDFFNRLDLLNDAFYKKLNDNFPNLSKTEKRLCSLIRLKLESQQIANFQNITLASVNTARYRLRKKLGLDESVNLDDFILHL